MAEIRETLVTALTEDVELGDLGITGSDIFQRDSFDRDNLPETKPFMVYALGLESQKGPSALRASRQTVDFWVHDIKGDFFRIESILDRVRQVVEGIAPENGSLDFRFMSRSRDLEDLDMGTICKYSTFEVTRSPL